MCNGMKPAVRGVGIDLCAIGRMEELLGNVRFLERFFTEEETAYVMARGAAAAQSMAGIFAAKEALLKALGVGIALPLKDVGVTHTETGQPVYCLTGKAKELAGDAQCMLSITHEGDMAAAVCIICG